MARNKQPYYHRAVVLFTATRDIPREELQNTLQKRLIPLKGLLPESIEVEEVDAEPGDPADLL